MSTGLYLVPTPIGNLEDITLRAIRILREVDTILAEDTRKTGQLLKHLEITRPLRSFHAHNEHSVVKSIVQSIVEGHVYALVSDAGTPAISDPGYLIVKECLDSDIAIECLPGPTAIIPALIKSGFALDSFIYEGFLPHKKGRKTKIESWIGEKRTVVLYESPHRIVKLLEQCKAILGDTRRISISRELTKMYEETRTGTIEEMFDYFSSAAIKGEFVVVLEGNRS